MKISEVMALLPKGPIGLFICTLLAFLLYTITSSLLYGLIISAAVTLAYMSAGQYLKKSDDLISENIKSLGSAVQNGKLTTSSVTSYVTSKLQTLQDMIKKNM